MAKSQKKKRIQVSTGNLTLTKSSETYTLESQDTTPQAVLCRVIGVNSASSFNRRQASCLGCFGCGASIAIRTTGLSKEKLPQRYYPRYSKDFCSEDLPAPPSTQITGRGGLQGLQQITHHLRDSSKCTTRLRALAHNFQGDTEAKAN